MSVAEFFHHLPPGWLSHNEAQAIYDAAKASKGDVLEIGTYAGRSSTVILEALRGTGRRLWCVDLPPAPNYCVPEGGRPDVAGWVARLKEKWGPAVVYFQGDIRAFRAAHSNLRFGLAFVDGNHDEEYVLVDALACREIVTGSILFHDYGSGNGCPGVAKALARAALVPTAMADSMAIVERRPLITFLTPVSRPENLAKVQASIVEVMGLEGWEWVLVYDLRHCDVPPAAGGPDPIYMARAFTCDYPGQAGNCCRNVALPHVSGRWVHHLDDDTIVHPGMAKIFEEVQRVPDTTKLFRFPIMIGRERGTNYDTGSWLVRTPAPLWNPNVWGGDLEYVKAIHPGAQLWTQTPGAHYNALRR